MRAILLYLIAFFCLSSCNKPSELAENPELLREHLEAMANEAYNQGEFHGSILVARGDSVVFVKGYGMASPEEKNSEQTPFRIASLTKALTATLILKLWQEEQLDIYDSVGNYFPEYPNPDARVITLHQLLSHSAGLPDYTRLPGADSLHRTTVTPESLVTFFARELLNFSPGTRFEYSNSGYALLGLIAEKVTGKSYAALLGEYIFQPMGMDMSGYHSPEKFSTFTFIPANGTLQRENTLDMSVPYAAGGITSTVMDLYRFNQGLSDHSLLADTLVQRMFTAHAGEYGYGWFVMQVPSFTDPDGQLSIAEHGGTITGFTAHMTRIPDDDIVIISLNNMESAQLLPLHIRIAGLLYRGEPAPDGEQELIQVR